MSRRFQEKLLAPGCVFVSIDYRLATKTKLPDIVEDRRGAWGCVRQ
jgi:acetyl esterase/lipase